MLRIYNTLKNKGKVKQFFNLKTLKILAAKALFKKLYKKKLFKAFFKPLKAAIYY
jgi:hypothetical protein